VVLVFIGGVLLDRIGVGTGTLLFASMAALGSVLVAVGPLVGSYRLMVLGRFIFGAGSESCFVAQNSILASWFSGKHRELGLAMGLGTSAGRLGTFVAFSASAWLYLHSGTYLSALFLSSGLCFLSFLAALLYFLIERFSEDCPEALALSSKHEHEDANSAGFLSSIMSSLSFSWALWLLAIVATTYYAAVFPFQGFSTAFLQERYNMSSVEAGQLTSIISLASLVLSPPMGLLADKIGMRVVLVASGSALLVPLFSLWVSLTVPLFLFMQQ